MNPFPCVTILLRLSLMATAINFTSQVFEWPNYLDYEWPSEANRTQPRQAGTLKPEDIQPRYMAVYKTRIFLSIKYDSNLPVSLVSLPTSGASSLSPKLTPVPSLDMHGYGNCNKIEKAKGLQVDSVGRLWVLDSGSLKCYSKIWAIDLADNDHTKLIYQFPFHKLMHDIVIDETPNGTFAYIALWVKEQIVVFSLAKNQSWLLDTPGVEVFSIALSPKEELPTQLYLVPDVATVTSNCTCEEGKTEESTNYALIGSLDFFLVLSCIFTLWLALRIRKLQNSNEQRNAGAVEMEMPTLPNPVSPEMVHEEIENDLYGVVTAPAPRPRM
ncbi:protein yellow-like [Cloeon dipterum]|uniref:protein yellow-like n=1 Tax=Cloeon dipterum TaxID=197152 RepID=UPI00321F8DFB